MTQARVRGGRLALFDLDGTLLRGASSERRFAAWLFANGHAGAFQAWAWCAHAFGHVVGDGRDVWRRDKAYLAGLDVSRVTLLAREHVDGVLASDGIDTEVRATLGRHQRAGDATVLLTGTLQPLAEAYADGLGIPLAIASLAPVARGRYARGNVRRHPYGPVKRELAEALRAELGAMQRDTVAYGDSIADRALLEWVGEAVAVEPDRALAALARSRAWSVLRHAPARRPEGAHARRANQVRGE